MVRSDEFIIQISSLCMHHHRKNRLRAYRQHWKLSVGELAELAGSHSASSIARVEQGLYPPSAAFVLAIEFIFGVAAEKMFPELVQQTREAVIHRAAKFSAALELRRNRTVERKRELLKDLIHRAPASSDGA